VVNDEASQTTAALLGHIEQRMTRVSNASTKDAPFGGHAVTLVGDFSRRLLLEMRQSSLQWWIVMYDMQMG
jgi:hypothetical protein